MQEEGKNMNVKIPGFIQENHFDLNAYLTFLFKKFHDSSNEEKMDRVKVK